MKSTIEKNEFVFEFEVLFSEIFLCPVLYFTILNVNSFKYLEFEDFKAFLTENENYKNSLLQINGNNNIINNINNSNTYEISKAVNKPKFNFQNHPLNGLVYNFMHLCKFSELLNTINNEFSNILLIWLSSILQIFEIELPILLFKN